MRKYAYAFGVVLLLGAPLAASAADMSVEKFYHKNTITFVVGAGAGGGYDLYSRIFTEYFNKYIPGHPNIVVQNMPGAGGRKAANYMANVPPHDGSVLTMPLPSTLVSEALRPKQVKYRLREFGWIGTISTMTDILAVNSDTGIKSIEDVKTTPVVIGSTSKLSQTNFQPALVNALLGTKFKVVQGYKSMHALQMAEERGEIKGHTNPWSSWITQEPEWIRDGKITLLIQFGPKVKELPNVPAFRDLVKTDKERRLVDFIGLMQQIGRAVAAPPGVPKERIVALRTAFDATVKDPKFVTDMTSRKLRLLPRSGKSLAAELNRILATEQETAAELRKTLGM